MQNIQIHAVARFLTLTTLTCIILIGCSQNSTSTTDRSYKNEDPSTFKKISTTDIGGEGAAEISDYDPQTKQLFIVNNLGSSSQIEVYDLSNPSAPSKLHTIDITPYGGSVNSLAIHKGNLAAAIEAHVKQNNGKVVVFDTKDYSEIKIITVGALPDMVAYTPNGQYILTANEGEPNDDYTQDPAGSISIIDSQNNYTVTNIGFSAFASQAIALKSEGFRVFGPGHNFVNDIEPEYIAISDDSKTAWVTLQENNGIAKIDIESKTLTDIFPLGFKDYNFSKSAIDPSDKDGGFTANNWPVMGMYLPDGIAVAEQGGNTYIFTANEGDSREYTSFDEEERVKNISLDPTTFPNASALQNEAQLGRLKITNTLGDTDGDGDYDKLYSFGARSFSVWNGDTGEQIYDSGNDLDAITYDAGVYDDDRSDDKSIEPESITIGKVGTKLTAFVGMERVDAVAIYDITDPAAPVFLKFLKTGDAPEGILFIPAEKSPVEKSLLVVSSEGDGVITIYQPI